MTVHTCVPCDARADALIPVLAHATWIPSGPAAQMPGNRTTPGCPVGRPSATARHMGGRAVNAKPMSTVVTRDPRCSVAVSIRDADVVIEGDAARVTEPGVVARIAKAWADNGWPAEPDESGSGITAPFNAPSQGPPPWNVYRIEPRSATVVSATEPGGLTRFRF